MHSSFFQRLIGLSTTHFGMSTPEINEERQARAAEILGRALRLAQEAERKAAKAIIAGMPGLPGPLPSGAGDTPRRARGYSTIGSDYEFELYPTPPAREADPLPARVAVRLPLILPAGVEGVTLEANEKAVRAALTDWVQLPDGRKGCALRFVTKTEPASVKRYQVRPAEGSASSIPVRQLQNEWLDLAFSEQTGIQSFRYLGEEFGGTDFLDPFVSYRTKRKPVVYPAAHWELLPLTDECWEGVSRVRLRAEVPMDTPFGEYTSQFTYTFSLFEELPHLYVDVEARYAATPCTETIHNMTQKLRRLMDLRWVEVAPFQLQPALKAPAGRPLRVWKHNYLGITSYYDLDYGRVNPRNRELDSFNHQVTAGWVAVSDGRHGLLLGENAEWLASMAFCPMRLRERPSREDGQQSLWLNPFGSYYGKQLDYSHLGAKGIGADFLLAFSGALKPNGPSYNGQTLRFSLLLAPYLGDEPPAALQNEAAAHFYPPGIVFHASPEGVEALLPADIQDEIASGMRQAAIAGIDSVPTPTAFLVNPSQGQVDLVWEPPRDVPLSGYEVAWRANGETEWQVEPIPPASRHTIPNLQDGKTYLFKLRAVCGSNYSAWTGETACTPGAVSGSGLSGFSGLPWRSLLRLVTASLVSVVRAWLGYRRNTGE